MTRESGRKGPGILWLGIATILSVGVVGILGTAVVLEHVWAVRRTVWPPRRNSP